MDIHKLFVVSHTHWDREWYQDFQNFRIRLVYMMDELLDTLEQDPSYKYFMLDGQTIIVDDYLEIRPERTEQLLGFIRKGRIEVGPWYVMPDEFLVSGESLIRNLLLGFRKARSWGVEPMKSGFLSDIFGHIGQMPQLLQGFNIDNAVLFRGFYGDADPSEIMWASPDGSEVFGLKLDEDRSYGDFFFFMRWPFSSRKYEPAELVDRAKEMLAYKERRATVGIALGLDGVDHIEIEPMLPWMLDVLNKSGLPVQFEHSSLSSYLEALRTHIQDVQLKRYIGEQRDPGHSGNNNWTPANVLSSRVHLKQLNQRCETTIERWAEPWAIFGSLEGLEYPRGLLSLSWKFLLQNHPHDSISGCSIDQVHRDMLFRFDQSLLISNAVAEERLTYLTNHISVESLLDGWKKGIITLFNASQLSIDGVTIMELRLPGGSDALIRLPHLMGTSFVIRDADGEEVPYQVLDIERDSIQRLRPYRDIPGAETVDRFRLALHAKVPSFGYASYTYEQNEMKLPEHGQYDAPQLSVPVRYPGSMQSDVHTWDNGCYELKIRSDGTFDLTDKKTGKTYCELLQFEDESDTGDGWSHVSAAVNSTYTSYGKQTQISVVQNGPFVAMIQIEATLDVPAETQLGAVKRSTSRLSLPIRTTLELRKNDPLLRIRTIVRNEARDHRLKAVFPTGIRSEAYMTSTPFEMVERQIDRPDRSKSLNPDRETVPHNGLIYLQDDEAGFALFSNGLYEAAVRNDKSRTLALTLFRSTRREVLTDGGDGGQLLGELSFEYAIRLFGQDEKAGLFAEMLHERAGARAIQRNIETPLYETPHRREANLPMSRSYMGINGEGLVISSIKSAEDDSESVIVRCFNVTNHSVSGSLLLPSEPAHAELVNLDEQSAGPVEWTGSQVRLQAGPYQIVTVKLRFRQV
ncbi:alpha-mannosidase [Paenibacillus eucommiae]|uniref:Alpha-mannosidase/mannosylglycerate hydrolase n=1 Tax=Paenibacillus eucommiae TaxID=1355755 RepID=A0ABS4J657_9BACL|nr:glycoside hydrolase family 38 C-terminal domain-containing protein [Paenibacillus eucommiae]MBP1995334.1 alpha-mannosidase/mannosylglycerate hydrolase [Paenibacillus eucommiae]